MTENLEQIPLWEKTFTDEMAVPIGNNEILFNPGHAEFLQSTVFNDHVNQGKIPSQSVRRIMQSEGAPIQKYIVVPTSLLVEKSRKQSDGQYSEVLGVVLDAIANEVRQFDLAPTMHNLEKYLAAPPSPMLLQNVQKTYDKLMSKLVPYGKRLEAANSYIQQCQQEFPENTFAIAEQLLALDENVNILKSQYPDLTKLLRADQKGEKIAINDQDLREAFTQAKQLQEESAFIQTNNRLSTRVFIINQALIRLESQTQGEYFENLIARTKAKIEELEQQFS